MIYHGVIEAGDYGVTVDSVLDNVAVWRTVINGYPYKSAWELGVEDDDDAFLATKQAIYCVLYGLDTSRYRGGDEKGQKIADAIVRITNEGRYGSWQPSDPQITLSNEGNMYEDGNYYTQKVNVSSSVDMANYTITATANLPAGTIMTNGNGTETNYFNGNESLYVKVPKSQMNNNISGAIINVQGKCKTYPVFYGATTVPGTQNYALTYDPFGDGVGRGTLDIKTNTGKIKINKTDDETHEPVSGVTFQLSKRDGTVIGSATTNENGEAYFNDLFQGDYVLKESATNKDYVINNAEFEVNVEYNKTATLEVTNEHRKGQIKVIKVDKDNNEVKLEGIEFKVMDSNGNVVDTLKTDKNGEATTKKIRTNQTYTIQETKTLQNYVLNDTPQKVTLTKDQIETITFENELKKGKVKVIKVDEDFNEIKLEGVEFKVYDEDNKLVDTLVTDKNGEAVSKDLRIDKEYTVKETKTKQEYILNNKPQKVTLQQDQITNITFENEHKKGNIKVYKIDKDNHKVVLGNVEFDLYSKEFDKVIGTYHTDVNGELEIKNLRIGDYSLIEKVSNKWYNLAEKQDIKVEWKLTKEIQIENELKKGSIKIIKVDEENHEVKLEGVKFKVMDSNGNTLEEIVTDKNGEATTKKYAVRDFSELKLQETETQEMYVLDNEIKTIKLEENQIKNITFENEKIRGQIEVIKVSANDNKLTGEKKGTPLKGAIFEIYNDKNELVDTIKTNDEGKAISKMLLKGEYTIKEIDSGSPFYLVNNDIFKAEIKEHKKVVDVKVEEESVDIDVDIEKRGFIETQSKDSIYYNFKNIRNKSNVKLDNFTWQDTLPTQALRVNKIYTGTWNEDLEYSIWYKTNKTDDYKMLVDKLSTKVNNEVNFKTVELAEDEYITEYEFRFGTVKVGFSEVEEPVLYCDMLENLGNGFVFTNHTKVSGNYEDKYVEDKDEWTTITYFKEIEVTQKLPRTGC